jgi:3-oxoadipate enol-lactonase
VTTQLERIGPAPVIAVESAGSGPLVVFLHGIGGNRTQWRRQLPVFAAQYRACAVDMRGYGASDDYERPLDFAAFSDDVMRVLDHCAAPRAHLVGLSMGGRIARDFYFRHPRRVATLTLANTSPGFDALSEKERAAFVRARQGPLRAGKEPKDVAEALASNLLARNATVAARADLIAMMGALHKASYLKTIEASVMQDRGAPLERIEVPTLVITSDADRLYTPALARDMARRIPGAQLVELAGAGHLSNIERPAEFNAAVLSFLARHA